MKIKALKLKDVRFDNWYTEIENKWEYEDFLKDDRWRRGWISFDCCLYLKGKNRIYCGITSFDADIFWIYDRKDEKFIETDFKKIKNPYDAKFHRSLVKWEKDGCIYAAIALLHDIDKYLEAPGGAIIRYNPDTEDIKKLIIPVPHHYIQSICLDQKRGIIYGCTFTPEKLFSFNITTGEVCELGPVGSALAMAQAENIEIDDDGCVWSGWNVTRAWQSLPGPDSHRLCKYDPVKKKIIYFKEGLPNPDGSYGFVKPEGLFNIAGKMFASGGNGSLYLVDTGTGKAKYLFTPVSNRRSRLASLRLGPDGYAYGVVGRDGNCELLQFDPNKLTYKLLGEIADGSEKCWQVHDVAITEDGTIYACENDNPYRSGYLWEIKL